MRLSNELTSLLFCLLLTGVAFANNVAPILTVLDAEKKVLFFEAGDLATSTMEVRFQDEKGEVLFSEYVVDPNSFVRNYNLSEMPNGTYNMVIVADAKTYVFPIQIEKESLNIEEEFRHLD